MGRTLQQELGRLRRMRSSAAARGVGAGAPFPSREQLRRRSTAVVRSFDAAKEDPLFSAFRGTNLSINALLVQHLRKMRARVRQESVNNDYLIKFLSMCRSNVIGPDGIRLEAKTIDRHGELDKADNEKLEQGWKRFCEKGICDVTGGLSMLDLENLWVETLARDGEVMVRHLDGYKESPFRYAVQILECDYLREDHLQEFQDGRRIVMGVEVNRASRPLRYHLRSRRANDFHGAGDLVDEEEVVTAKDIDHSFIRHRPEQVRGYPWVHSALRRLHMLYGYEEAETVASRASASKMGFITTPDGQPFQGEGEDDEGNIIDEASPGRFQVLSAGQRVESWDPQHPNSAYRDFMKTALRGAASGMNVAYNSLSNDLEGVSYSSIRTAVLEERACWRALQKFTIENLMQPIYRRWLRMAIASGELELPMSKFEKFLNVVWHPRGWDWVDPEKDQKANSLELVNKTITRTEICASRGRSFEDVVKTLAKEESLIREHGLTAAQVDSAIGAGKPKGSGDVEEEPGDADEQGGANADKDKGLNGAQIIAAKDIIADVISGSIPPSVAEQLLVAVGIEPAVAAEMVAEAQAFDPATAPDDEEEDEGGVDDEETDE